MHWYITAYIKNKNIEGIMRSKTDSTRTIDHVIGAQLRRLRKIRGYTQHDVAQALGISYQQLHKYETGANSIAASRLYELAIFLSVKPDDFFEGVDASEEATESGAAEMMAHMPTKEEQQLLRFLSAIPHHKRSAVIGLIRTVGEE
jgi:transcriptional regulator with XRE-family HTH domain